MSTFLRHEPCPECGSTDNVSVYWNDELNGETYYCETPNCSHAKSDKRLAAEKSSLKFDDSITLLHSENLEKLGFPSKIATKYELRKRGKELYFVYKTPTGITVDAKVRDYKIPKTEDFHFTWYTSATKGNVPPKRPFFGMESCNATKRKALVITEGEFDALSAYTMMDYDSISVPSGSKSALKYIKMWFDWLDQYEYIYLVFDNDEAGQIAAQECAAFMGYKVRNVVLPALISGVTLKDSYDYLKNGFTTEYQNILRNAVPVQPSYILDHDDFVERLSLFLFDEDRRIGFSSGLPELDRIIGGYRRGEISTSLGIPGRGKSSLARFTMHNMIKQNIKVLYLSLEEQPEVALCRLLELVTDQKLIANAGNLTKEDIVRLAETIRGKVVMADLSGSLSLEMLKKIVYYGVKQHDVQFVVLDHITAAVNSDELQWKAISSMMDALNQLAQEHKIHCHVISHTVRKDSRTFKRNSSKSETGEYDEDETEELSDDPIPTLQDAASGSGVERYTHLQIALRRLDSRGIVKIYVLKNRLLGTTGVITTTYEQGKYKATKVYIAGRSGQGHQGGLETRGSSGDALPRQGDTAERVGIRTALPAGDSVKECSVPGDNDTRQTESDSIVPTVSDTSTQPGLPSAEQSASRNERSDGRVIPPESGATEASAPNDVRTIQDSVLTSVPPHPRQARTRLRGMGGQTEPSLGREPPDTSRVVQRTDVSSDTFSLDSFLGQN